MPEVYNLDAEQSTAVDGGRLELSSKASAMKYGVTIQAESLNCRVSTVGENATKTSYKEM